jgi:hypothetical protein
VVAVCMQPGKYVPVEIDHDAALLPHPSASQARIIEYKPSRLDEATQVHLRQYSRLNSTLRHCFCSGHLYTRTTQPLCYGEILT